VGGGWLLADLDYDEFQDETHYTPRSGAYSSADAGRRRLAVIQRELTRLTSLPKSEGTECCLRVRLLCVVVGGVVCGVCGDGGCGRV
jgi:hypothetical protein